MCVCIVYVCMSGVEWYVVVYVCMGICMLRGLKIYPVVVPIQQFLRIFVDGFEDDDVFNSNRWS